MKILNTLLILLFLYSTAVQYNDPDPYVWMPIYLYGVLICYLAIRGRYSFPMYVVGLVTYTTYATYLFIDTTGVLSWITEHNAESIVQSMKATKPWIEETREFLGLMILDATFVTNMIWLRRKQASAVKSEMKQGKIAGWW